MTHYSNVSALLKLSEKYDINQLCEVIEVSDIEVLADDIAYIITTVFESLNIHERKRIKEKLLNEITKHETEQIEFEFFKDGEEDGVSYEEREEDNEL